jgi:hypothetical protein
MALLRWTRSAVEAFESSALLVAVAKHCWVCFSALATVQTFIVKQYNSNEKG